MRVLYIVAREQPMLCGYLIATVGTRSPDGHLVEIKLDERRGERRLAREARDPERRRGERRLQPSLDSDLRSRGYATVVQSEARAGRRSRVRWGLILVLLATVGVAIVVARSIPWAPAPPATAPPIPPRIEEAPPPPPVSNAEPVGPTPPSPPPSRPAPVRIVSTRSSGVVLSVDPRARTLVLEERGAADVAGRRRVELAPDARVVLSERDDQAEDLSRPFKDTAISLADVRRGDYVVVEMRGPEGKELARSVVVTFRPH